MEDKFKVFIFDLDDTLVDSSETFFELAYSITGKRASDEDISKRKEVHLSKCGLGYSDDDERRVAALMKYTNTWERLKLYDGAKDLISKIMMNGYVIIFLTARNEGLREQTKKCLYSNGIGVSDDNLIMSGHYGDKDDKFAKIITDHRKVFKDNVEFHYFENDPSHLRKAIETSVDFMYTFNNPYMADFKFESNWDFEDRYEIFDNPTDCFKVVLNRLS